MEPAKVHERKDGDCSLSVSGDRGVTAVPANQGAKEGGSTSDFTDVKDKDLKDNMLLYCHGSIISSLPRSPPAREVKGNYGARGREGMIERGRKKSECASAERAHPEGILPNM